MLLKRNKTSNWQFLTFVVVKWRNHRSWYFFVYLKWSRRAPFYAWLRRHPVDNLIHASNVNTFCREHCIIFIWYGRGKRSSDFRTENSTWVLIVLNLYLNGCLLLWKDASIHIWRAKLREFSVLFYLQRLVCSIDFFELIFVDCSPIIFIVSTKRHFEHST